MFFLIIIIIPKFRLLGFISRVGGTDRLTDSVLIIHNRAPTRPTPPTSPSTRRSVRILFFFSFPFPVPSFIHPTVTEENQSDMPPLRQKSSPKPHPRACSSAATTRPSPSSPTTTRTSSSSSSGRLTSRRTGEERKEGCSAEQRNATQRSGAKGKKSERMETERKFCHDGRISPPPNPSIKQSIKQASVQKRWAAGRRVMHEKKEGRKRVFVFSLSFR